MIGDIRQLIGAKPFVPFRIHLGDGSTVRVPTPDHIFTGPRVSRVFVFTDDDEYHIIGPLLISHLTLESGSPASNE